MGFIFELGGGAPPAFFALIPPTAAQFAAFHEANDEHVLPAGFCAGWLARLSRWRAGEEERW